MPYLPLVDALRSFTAEELPPVLEHWRRGEIETGGNPVVTGHGSRSGLRGLPRPAAGQKRRGPARARHRGRALG